MSDKPITDSQREKIEEPLSEAAAEIKALLREIDEDDYVSQEGWIDCLDRIQEHLRTTRAFVRNL
jgi:hypothetical protein